MVINKSFLIITLGIVSLTWSSLSLASCGGDTQYNCMVATINGEARGEGYEGMLVAGKTLKTRKLRNYYGKTICGISKRGFAPRSLRSTGTKGKTRSLVIKAAKAACASGDAGYSHFHSYRGKHDRRAPWARKFRYVGKVGGHWLFNAPRGIRANFDELATTELKDINEESFFTEADYYFYGLSDEKVSAYYTKQDDEQVELILSAPINESVDL
ncbi:MAG: hypothetical protein ACRBBP_07845 [Bdellovibrionales bacterium]